jgi:predicted protein tyrosine phosphatase
MGMPHIYVCGLDDVSECVQRFRPARLISLLPASEQPATPHLVAPGDHLRIAVDDIAEPKPGATAPDRVHVDTLINFLRTSPLQGSILIHCLAGMSRSPAAALIAMVLDAPGCEREAAKVLREAAPFAEPNRLLIRLADEALARGGRLVAARDAMGPIDLSRGFATIVLPRSFAPPGH